MYLHVCCPQLSCSSRIIISAWSWSRFLPIKSELFHATVACLRLWLSVKYLEGIFISLLFYTSWVENKGQIKDKIYIQKSGERSIPTCVAQTTKAVPTSVNALSCKLNCFLAQQTYSQQANAVDSVWVRINLSIHPSHVQLFHKGWSDVSNGSLIKWAESSLAIR